MALTPFHNIRTYFPHLQDLLATKLLARSSGGQVLVLIFVSSSSAIPLFVAHVCNKLEVSHLVCGIVFYYSQLQSNLEQFACLVAQRAREQVRCGTGLHGRYLHGSTKINMHSKPVFTCDRLTMPGNVTNSSES
jgi:hypothetical protein